MTVEVIDGRFVLEPDPPRVGGTAHIYKARDHDRDGTLVAVKLFDSAALEDEVLRESFLRERESLEALDHPNIVKLYAAGFDAGRGQHYVALEWIDEHLLEYIERRTKEGADEARNPGAGWDSFSQLVLAPVLTGLGVAHGRRILHRDIKPQNILVDPAGVPKLADFGLAKLLDSLRLGMTVREFHSKPYAAPERYRGELDARSDLYSLGVTTLKCLLPSSYDFSQGTIGDALHAADLPEDGEDFLKTLVAEEPDERVSGSRVALAELNRLFAWRPKVSAGPRRRLAVRIAKSVVDEIEALVDGGAPGSARRVIERDLGDEVFMFRKGSSSRGWAPEEETYEFLGNEFQYLARFHSDHDGSLVLIGVREVPASLLERRKEDALHISHELVFDERWRPLQEDVDTLVEELKRHEQVRAVDDARRAEQAVFQTWHSVLDAKADLEAHLEDPFVYRGLERNDMDVTFDVLGEVDETVVGQERRVAAAGSAGRATGIVSTVSGGQVTVTFRRGDLASIPMSGKLIVDRTPSRRAIDHQKLALTAVREGTSVRSDLGTLLSRPEQIRAPEPASVTSYFQPELDEPKRRAVETALGSPDFTLVEGPPGTGKTTFISELICQLREAEERPVRVLLSSQTHVAVDHAAVGVAKLRDDLIVVRVGRSEKISVDAQQLGIEPQMERWKHQAEERARGYLREWAIERGISEEARAAYSDLQELGVIEAEIQRVDRRIAELEADEERVLERLTDPEATSSRPEHDTDLEDELAAIQADGEERQKEREKLTVSQSVVSGRLAKALGVESLEGADLRSLVEERFPVAEEDLEAFTELTALQEEWLLRFGQGREFERALIDRADVVAGTCVGLASMLDQSESEFDVAIVDEASKATPTEALVPMARSARWVLVGDTRQLPPFVERALDREGFLADHDLLQSDLEETIFGRLIGAADRNVVSLTRQHRMLTPIGDLISDCFYEGRLTSSRGDESDLESVRRAFAKPVLWLSTSELPKHMEQRVGTTYWNAAELEAIRETLGTLQFFAEQLDEVVSVGVLSAYAGQAQELRRALRRDDARWTHLRIDINPVDSFQGQERDVVLYSVVRSNKERNLGFLRSDERINVALSRGRDALVIVGDSKFCETGGDGASPLGRVLRHVRAGQSSELEVLARA